MSLSTVPNQANVSLLELTTTYTVICSVNHKPFHGEVAIVYCPVDKLLDFVSFENWLDTLVNQELTPAELTRLVFDAVQTAIGASTLLDVNVYAQHETRSTTTVSINSIGKER